MCSPRPDLQYHYAGSGSRRITKNLAEIAIQCNERSTFPRAYLEQCLVSGPSQPLASDCCHIVAGGTDKVGGTLAEIFVGLEFHAAVSEGTGMTRTRAASAPYAIAAKTSSWVSPGYSPSSSASVMPSDRKSRTSETQIRVPLMQGFAAANFRVYGYSLKKRVHALPRMLARDCLATQWLA